MVSIAAVGVLPEVVSYDEGYMISPELVMVTFLNWYGYCADNYIPIANCITVGALI